MIIWMIFIFIMSNTNGNDSSSQSNFFANIILQFINIDKETLTFLIRKLAHMSEYAVLTLTFIYGFYKNQYPLKKIIVYSLICAFLYACTDEFHQLFIGGRAGQFTDVLIDTCGALITIVIYYFYNYWKRKNSSLK